MPDTPPFLNTLRLLLLLMSCWLAVSTQGQNNHGRNVGVTVSPAESLMYFPTRNAPAKTETLNRSLVPAQITAVIKQIRVRVGDTVKQEDTLAQLDCREAKQHLAAQQAQQKLLQHQFEFAQRQLNRGKGLKEHKSIGEAEFDNLETNLSVSLAQLTAQKAIRESAKIRVNHCTVNAPFSGMVISRIADVGEMLNTGAPVLEMVELDNLEVSAEVPLADSVSFAQAQSFYFETSGTQYSLKKRILLPLVANETRSREARLTFTGHSALPGITGRLFWKSPQAHLPAHLLQERNGLYGVFILQGNVVKFIEINQAQEGRPIPLLDQEQWHNRQLVIDGRHGLINNQPVSVMMSDENKGNGSLSTVGSNN